MAEQTTKPAEKQSTTVTLKSPDGSQLKVLAKVDKKTGQASSFIVHSTVKNGNGKREHSRGATQTHKTLAEAIAAMQQLAVTAVKMGWSRPTPPTLGKKPDAFDAGHIPAPKSAPKK